MTKTHWWLFLLAVSCGGPTASPPELVRHGVVTYLDGPVSVQKAGVWVEADVGTRVDESSLVKTGRGGTCDLQFGRVGTLHLAENTVVSLKTVDWGAKKTIDVEMVSGQLTAKVSKLLGGQKFHVRTDTVVAGVRGTRFLVSKTGGKTQIAVAEGLVGLVSPSRSPDEVQQALAAAPSVGAGNEAEVVRAGGVPAVRPLGEENRKALDATAGMIILETLPAEPAARNPQIDSPLLTPASGAVIHTDGLSELVFRWTPFPDATGYEVALLQSLDEGSRPVTSWTSPSESVTLLFPGQLEPGTYVWEVAAVKTKVNFTQDRSPPVRGTFQIAR